MFVFLDFFFSSRRRHTRCSRDWSSDVCSSDLDLCAAPGGKTTHVAALLEDRGEVVAVERHPGRAAALQRTCARMRAGCVRVEVAVAVQWSPGAHSGDFDRV